MAGCEAAGRRPQGSRPLHHRSHSCGWLIHVPRASRSHAATERERCRGSKHRFVNADARARPCVLRRASGVFFVSKASLETQTLHRARPVQNTVGAHGTARALRARTHTAVGRAVTAWHRRRRDGTGAGARVERGVGGGGGWPALARARRQCAAARRQAALHRPTGTKASTKRAPTWLAPLCSPEWALEPAHASGGTSAKVEPRPTSSAASKMTCISSDQHLQQVTAIACAQGPQRMSETLGI